METSLYERFFEIEDWYWWSVGTRALFREWLGAVIVGPERSLLDIGCGSGALAAELGHLGRVTGVDVALQAVDFAHRRGLERLCVGRAEALPFRSARFDAVTALDVVEHTDDRQTLGEIARVLKRGGAALVQVPAFGFLWGEHDEANHHLRRYRRRQLREAVQRSGLTVERLSYANTVLFPAAAAVRLGKRVLRAARAPRPPRAEIYMLPRWMNTALTGLLGLERAALRRVDLPIGVSLLCLARKP
jgi:SAM-dependent methyltransferase